MSLRDLARQHLEAMARTSLSGVRTHRGVRPGQNASIPYSSKDRACPDAGHNPDSLSGPDKCEAAGHSGQLGRSGQFGHSGQRGTNAVISLEQRRHWWAQPVEDCRDGRLTLRNIARDETVVIDLKTGRRWRA